MAVSMTLLLPIIAALTCRLLCKSSGLGCCAWSDKDSGGHVDRHDRLRSDCVNHENSLLERLSGHQGDKSGQRRKGGVLHCR